MAETRKTEVVYDADGRPIDTVETIERTNPAPKRGAAGFGWGLLFGVLIIAAAVIIFAYSRGSFEQAGAEADRAASYSEGATRDTAADISRAVGQAAEAAGDAAEQAGDDAKGSADNLADHAKEGGKS